MATALQRDLQLSPAEFDARGDLAAAAAAALPKLRQIDGFAGIAVSGESPARLLIAGTGSELEQAAADLDAKMVAPGSLEETPTPSPSPSTTTPTPSTSPSPTTPTPTPSPSTTTTTPDPNATTSNSSSHAVAPSAVVPETATPEPATSVRALLEDYEERYGSAGLSRLQSIMRTADGSFEIRMDSSSGQLQAPGTESATKPDQQRQAQPNFTAGYTNVNIAPADGPAKPLADPLVGGLGTLTKAGGFAAICSIGFNAYSPTGEPASISAGHCTMDGTYKDVFLTDPTKDRAAQSGASKPGVPVRMEKPELLAELGTYAFSQFGGPGNTPGTAPKGGPATNIGTDVSVISVENEDLNQLPAVTDWGHPAEPAISGPMVLGATRPVIGAPVCKSGRTTGWTCGTVDAIGIFLVAGKDYYPEEMDTRVIQGFRSSDLYSATGDSGGAMISGSHSLGVVSAGTGEESSTITFGASIGPMLQATNGYTLQVFVSAPRLRSHHDGGTVETTEMIRGIAPAGSKVKITSGGQTLDVQVRPGGRWRFRAPDSPGVFTFKAVASKGFSASETRTYRLIVEQPPPPPKEEDSGGTGGQVPGTGQQQPDTGTEVSPAAGHSEPLADTGAAGDPFMFALFGGGFLAVGSLLLLAGRLYPSSARRRYTNSC